MGRKKLKVDYLMQYGDEIALLRDGLSLRRVRSRTGRAINTLRKLRTLFVIWIIDPPSPNPNNLKVPTHPEPSPSPNDHRPHLCTPMQPVEPWCNLSNHIDTRKLVGLFRGDATGQPDDPTPFSKKRKSFRSPGRSKISRGTSRSKKLMNPERTGYGGQLESQPSTVEN